MASQIIDLNKTGKLSQRNGTNAEDSLIYVVTTSTGSHSNSTDINIALSNCSGKYIQCYRIHHLIDR